MEGLDKEIGSLKQKVESNEGHVNQEMAALRAQVKLQDEKIQYLASGLKEEILTETQKHFNGFTRHLEWAFVKEQAATRRQNLIFTGVEEGGGSELTVIRDICKTGLRINNISITSAYRVGTRSGGSYNPRSIMVHFRSVPDRSRVWQAKKRLQRGDYTKVWIQEDMPRILKEDLCILIKVAKRAEFLNKEEYRSLKVKDFCIHLNGMVYPPSSLESLPIELRPSTICIRKGEELIVFFGRYTPLSNHFCSPFELGGSQYLHVEQYLAVESAKLSGKEDIIDRAKSLANPADAKSILNSLRDDHVQEWEESRATLIINALRCKFTQNQLLGNYLRSTYPLHLGEASKDPVWGIGFNLLDDDAMIFASWAKDGNLLGRSLCEIRGELIQRHGLLQPLN